MIINDVVVIILICGEEIEYDIEDKEGTHHIVKIL